MPLLCDRLAIIGVGLMGGSLGLALRRRRLVRTVVGVGHRQTSIDEALRLGAIDEGTLDPVEGVRDADLVVICTAIRLIPELGARVAGKLKSGCVVTDVGSTKAMIVREMEGMLDRDAHFVGSHPIAGSEKRGVAAAVEDLYDDAVCVVTPTANSSPDAVAKVQSLWESVGARVLTLSPEEHDGILARTSHLPHVAAAMLIGLVEDRDRSFVGTGFRDTTRIASGDPDIWTDILLTNRDAILRALGDLAGQIQDLSRALSRRDRAAIRGFLDNSKQKRDGLFGK